LEISVFGINSELLCYSKAVQGFQAGELSENSLISEIFVSTSEKIMQVFLVNAYAFRDFLFNLQIEFSEIFFYIVFSTLALHDCTKLDTCCEQRVVV
jgi:hypothetical protein